MRKRAAFLGQYRLFSLTLGSSLVALVLAINNLSTPAHWVLGVISLIVALRLLWEMLQDVRAGAYGIDILAITAIVSAVILGQFWAAIVVVLMLTGGESLEDFATHRARIELDTLIKQVPHRATVIRKGKELRVRAADIRVGEKIIIKAGEVVPVDAIVLEGNANFDEASLTGESLPQAKAANSLLLSGSINLDGAVTARTTQDAEHSQYQQIIKLVRSAAASRSPYVRLAERYSLPFTAAAYTIAIAVWVVSGQAIRFLEVIIVATPCPLLLAAPIALISGMSRASRHGIIIKTGAALERMAEARTVAFDKTGTLTRGQLQVDKITAFSGFSEAEMLRLAASLEQNSTHVVAQAIVEYAKAGSIKLTKVKHVKEIAGRGLSAHLQGKDILVGRLSLLEAYEVTAHTKFNPDKIKQTAVYVAVDGQLAGVVTLGDQVRPEAEATIAALKRGGIKKFLMVTGDNTAAAQQVAKSLGIDEVHAETLPAEKLHIVEGVSEKDRPLIFVGDGVNDAPVLASADIGVALGARGSAAASESADVVVMLDDVTRVATAQVIAKRTFKIASQSIFAGMALSLLLMAIFATGKFPPLAGALLQEVVDVVVIFNALRAHF